MKTNRHQNEQIKSALSQRAVKIDSPEGLFNKIKTNIKEQECGQTMGNKVIRMGKGKRLAVIAATFILLGSIAVLGTTMGKSWVGHTNLKYKVYPSQEKVLKDVGFVPKYTQSLPGGYEYNNGGTGESTLTDGSGNVLTKTKEVTFGYIRQEDLSRLGLTIRQLEEEFFDNRESKLVGDLDGIALYYYDKDYKFVPPSYELTEEDKRAKEAGELEISYGASKVSIENIQGLSWYEDGLGYMLMGSGCNFTVEELIEMAKVVVAQNR